MEARPNNFSGDSEYDKTVLVIKADQKKLCPQAKDFYVIDDEIFEEIWEEFNSKWLQPSNSSLDKVNALKLLKGLRLESLTTQAVKGLRSDPYALEGEELEIMYSLPIQYEGTMAYSKPERQMFYWHVEWVDMIPGFCQTVSGHIHCPPFAADPPMQLLHDNETRYNYECNTWRRGWNLKPDKNSQKSIETYIRGANLLRQISTEDATRILIPAIGILGRKHPANKNSSVLKRLMLRLENEICAGNKGYDSNTNEFHSSGVGISSSERPGSPQNSSKIDDHGLETSLKSTNAPTSPTSVVQTFSP